MKFAVALQPVADFAKIVFDKRLGKISTSNVPLILNAADRNAIQVALETNDGTSVLCIGQKGAENVLREALSYGIQNAYLIESEFSDASLLAKAFSELKLDTMIFGETTMDYGYTGIAEATASKLGSSFLSRITSMRIENGRIMAAKTYRGKSLKIELPIPCVVTAKFQKEMRRYPTPVGIREAYQKEIKRLRFDVKEIPAGLTIKKIAQAEIRKAEPTIIKGDAKQVVADAMRLLRRVL